MKRKRVVHKDIVQKKRDPEMLREIEEAQTEAQMLGTDIRWNWSWSEPFESLQMSKSHKDSWQNRANNKGIRWDRKTKTHLWHLCTLLVLAINTNKTTKSQNHCGKVNQARKNYCLQTQLSWWLSGSLPVRNLLQEQRSKVPPGPENHETAYPPASFTWRRPYSSISLWPASH